MTNLLTGLDKLIADVAGPLLFSPAQIIRKARTADGRGGFTEAETASACEALVTEYSAFVKGQLGIPDTDRKVLVLGHGLDPAPVPGNVLVVDGYRWVIVTTTRDPAKAVYECQGRADGAYVPPSPPPPP